MRRTAAAFLLSIASMPSYGADEPELVTSIAAVVCARQGNLTEALQAAIHNDKRWLEEIGCSWVPKGQSAVIIERVPHNLTFVWKIRLRPGQPDGVTVWTSTSALVTAKGQWLDENGKPR